MTLSHDTLFKALDGTISPVAGYEYPVGEWTEHLDPDSLYPCRVGYHLARGDRILPHLRSDLYVADPCPEHGAVELHGQTLTCQTRLTKVHTWTAWAARLFAADCAEAALLGERSCGREPDGESWAVVDAARMYVAGTISTDDLSAVGAAAWAAAWGTRYAAESAAWSANRSAVVSALSAAAAAAQSASSSATTWSAAQVAEAAAWSVLFDRLALYLNGEPLPPVTPLYGPTVETSTR